MAAACRHLVWRPRAAHRSVGFQQLAHVRARTRESRKAVPRREPALSTDVQAAIKEADFILASANMPFMEASEDCRGLGACG